MSKPTAKDEPFYTAPEVAQKLRLTTRAVQKWCVEGRFAGAFKMGDGTSPWRIPVRAYDAFIAERLGAQTEKS